MYKYLIISLGLLFAFASGFLVARLNPKVSPDSTLASVLREKVNNYTYINPLLACLQSENAEGREFMFLQKKIQSITEKAESAGEIEDASIYFRHLLQGHWIGINETAAYSPASLLKVPVAIAYLKQAETKPELLRKTFPYKQSPQNVTPLIDERILSSDHTYTAMELIRGMLIDSDNDAKDLLVAALDPKFLNEVYFDLGIQSPYTSTPTENDYHISTKTYGLFFRVLYNSTLLNRQMSETLLTLLSETKFSKGLRAGLPPEVAIAHKYGVRVTGGLPKHTIELSDCGIVYANRDPYLLCIMTKGNELNSLVSYIEQVSQTTYEAMRAYNHQ